MFYFVRSGQLVKRFGLDEQAHPVKFVRKIQGSPRLPFAW
jgi:hypothetical protein